MRAIGAVSGVSLEGAPINLMISGGRGLSDCGEPCEMAQCHLLGA